MHLIAQTGRERQLFGDLVAPPTSPAFQPVAQAAPVYDIQWTICHAADDCRWPAKSYGIDDAGAPVRLESGGQPAEGVFIRRGSRGAAGQVLEKLAADLMRLKSREALMLVPPPYGFNEPVPFRMAKEVPVKPVDFIARTKRFFPPVRGPALLGLDFDLKKFPPDLTARIDAAGGVPEVLKAAYSGFAKAALLWRASSSAGIRNKQSGQETARDAGLHLYFVVPNGEDIPRFVDALDEHLKAGGWCFAGQSVLDTVASKGSERLWFEGPPILDDERLEFVPGVREPKIINKDGGALDTAGLPGGKASGYDSRTGEPRVSRAELVAPIDLVRRAIAAMPNSAAHFPTRQEWVAMCFALVGATADDQSEGNEIWHGWSADWPDYDDGDAENLWSDICERGSQTGIGWLAARARDIGGEAGQAVWRDREALRAEQKAARQAEEAAVRRELVAKYFDPADNPHFEAALAEIKSSSDEIDWPRIEAAEKADRAAKSGPAWLELATDDLAARCLRAGLGAREFAHYTRAAADILGEPTNGIDALALAAAWAEAVTAQEINARAASSPTAVSAPSSGDDAAALFGGSSNAQQPVDIFGHADPAELGNVPAGALPSVLAAWVKTEARRKGVSEAFAAASAVAVVSAAIGNALRIQPKQRDTGWTEPASLWVTLVAPPGSAKSAIISEAARPLKALDSNWRREWGPRHAEWAKRDAEWRKRRRDSYPPGDEPKCRRAVLDNFTSEKAIRVFAENPRGVICTPDELVGMLGSFGAYKRGGDGDRALMLRFFDGAEAMADRVGGGTVYAESALLGLLASTQPDKIHELADGMGGDGLLQRFLFVIDDGRDRVGADEEPDVSACEAYAAVVSGLATLDVGKGVVVRIAPEAATIRENAVKQLRSLKWLFGASPALQGHVEKYDKFLARLILTFHCLEQASQHGTVDREKLVAPETVRRAVTFAEFLMRHSLKFYREFVGTTDIENETIWVAEFLLSRPELTTVRERTLYDAKKSFRGERGNRLLRAVLKDLESAGWLTFVPGNREAGTKDGYAVNSEIHIRFAEHGERAMNERNEARRKIAEAVEARRRISADGDHDG